jgi:hypothetical protein
MKNHISDEEKRKQIEQMWEDYERTNRSNTPPFKTNNFFELNGYVGENLVNDVYNEDVKSSSFESLYAEPEFTNKKQIKRTSKKLKISKIPDEDPS